MAGETYYDACENYLVLSTTQKLLRKSFSRNGWCELHTIPDQGYNLPEVAAARGGDGDTSAAAPGSLDVLCGQPVISGVANPIAAVGDGVSNLLYIVEQRGWVRPHTTHCQCSVTLRTPCTVTLRTD
jgi:hypothetical protein